MPLLPSNNNNFLAAPSLLLFYSLSLLLCIYLLPSSSSRSRPSLPPLANDPLSLLPVIYKLDRETRQHGSRAGPALLGVCG